MAIELPIPSTTFEVPLDDGARIRVRRHGSPEGVRILFSHGNGFAADGYFPFWQQFLHCDLFVFDFRNHGQNVPVDPPNHHYAQLSRDLDRVMREVETRFGAKRTIGVFHSMSSRTAQKHALEIGWRWDALVLFDPPSVPPPGHALYDAMVVFEHRLADYARSRRTRFASVEEMAAEYRNSRATKLWVPGVHELMARSVLRKDPTGEGWLLVCHPENEAGIYEQALTLNLWPKANEFPGPVKLIGADPTIGPASARANQALGIENGFDYSFVPESGHMLQIEKPDECVREVTAFLGKHGLAPAA
jgi:pimeloyl-ACP methyl ester carboxylesterase